ncbi:MAG TPA: glycosyltransferase family 4 protein [Smithellaceae bacterium]|nr:glycosyltransferase family 4 protein [Smithellaceae bacterium]HRV44877.1 glycosyltransferase family 4 protein [Smithellaceae bacterium]
MIQDITTVFNQLVSWVTQYRMALLLATCAALGAAGAWLIAGIPFREHLLDAPNERSSHTEPTPRGGGVGILAAFIVAGLTLRIPTTFLFAAVFVSAVSFYGDFFRLSVRFRFLAQLFAALVFLFPILPALSAHYAASTFGFSPFLFFLILLLIVVFMIGTANFYNFMDGINGIAGLSGAIAFGLLGAYTLYYAPLYGYREQMSLLSVCIALACMGYLPFNLPRARVFMGDVGSILLGFVFAALVIMLARNYQEMACFAALLFPFYADELTTMAVRLQDRESLVQSHRRHLYQLLANEAGMAHWKVTLIYGVAQLAVGGGVLFLNAHGAQPVVLFLTACFIAFALVSLLIRGQIKKARP